MSIISRDESLDALRGMAILGMVLSGSIAFTEVMPRWMFHAQVPPPLFKFDPSVSGITWVDLVFPFFLFAMGAAMPLSLSRLLDKSYDFITILKIAIQRFLLLVFFALFSQQIKAWVLSEQPEVLHHVLSLAGFGLLSLIFTESRWKYYNFLKWGGVCSGLGFLYFFYSAHGGFSLYKSDIIIMVLANMAFFGTIIYYLTHDKPMLRIGILPFIFAFFVAGKETQDSWTKLIFLWDNVGGWKIDWMYKFYFLKYLFIVIPGMFAGEWLKSSDAKKDQNINYVVWPIVLMVMNLGLLMERLLFLNFIVSLVLCVILIKLSSSKADHTVKKLVFAGTYSLLLGLCLEAYEGGIRKDGSTYSYYFVTSGLAFYILLFFRSVTAKAGLKMIKFLGQIGKNPMVAYVAGSLVVIPLLKLTGLSPYWDQMNFNVAVGLIKGVLFTALVALITLVFVKRGWFWKT